MSSGTVSLWELLWYAAIVAAIGFVMARIGHWRARRAEARKLGRSLAAQAEQAHEERTAETRSILDGAHKRTGSRPPRLGWPMVGLVGGALLAIGCGPFSGALSLPVIVQLGAIALAIYCAKLVGDALDRLYRLS
jgi:hypothetical protein